MQINGIKLSNELAQINLFNTSNPYILRSLFFQLFTENQINIPIVMVTGMGEKISNSCCVDINDINRVKNLLYTDIRIKENVELILSVGALTLFPHHSNLKLLGLSFDIFGQEKIKLYGITSSISSLTFITDYSKLDRAVTAIRKHFDVSSRNFPLRPEIHVKQKKIF